MSNSPITPTLAVIREHAPLPVFPTSVAPRTEQTTQQPRPISSIMGVLTFQKDPREKIQDAARSTDPNEPMWRFSEATGMPLPNPTLEKAA